MNGFYIVITENREIKRIYMKLDHVPKYIKENPMHKVIREAYNQEAVIIDDEGGKYLMWRDIKSTDYNG